MHACVHACEHMHACMRACVRACVHVRLHACMHVHMRACTLACMCTCMIMHVCENASAHMVIVCVAGMCACMHANACAHTRSWQTRMYTVVCACARVFARARVWAALNCIFVFFFLCSASGETSPRHHVHCLEGECSDCLSRAFIRCSACSDLFH